MPFGDGFVYKKLGVKPFINAVGHGTFYGGRNHQVVQEAIDSAGLLFVETRELQKHVGNHIAKLLGVEASLPAPGCAAAIMFSIAGCMAGSDSRKQRSIPNTAGMKNEVVLPAPQRSEANRIYEVPGAKVIYAGTTEMCSPADLASAIGDNTAAVGYEVHRENGPGWSPGSLHLDEAVKVAHSKNLPVIADAASQSDPPDYMRHLALSADLVCFGAKYFGGPNNGGFVCGRKDLVDSAAAHNFISEAHDGGFMPWGRGHKLDRISILSTVVALEEWLTGDHEDRVLEYRRRISVVENKIGDIEGVRSMPSDDGNSVELVLSDPIIKSAEQVVTELDMGEPRIKVSSEGNKLKVAVFALNPGDEVILADRISEVLKP